MVSRCLIVQNPLARPTGSVLVEIPQIGKVVSGRRRTDSRRPLNEFLECVQILLPLRLAEAPDK
jgi:hypothetical protein